MTMYGWGNQDTLGHATSFIGTTVSWCFCDKFYASLTSNIVSTVIRLLYPLVWATNLYLAAIGAVAGSYSFGIFFLILNVSQYGFPHSSVIFYHYSW